CDDTVCPADGSCALGPPLGACAAFPPRPIAYETVNIPLVVAAEGTPSCTQPSPPAADIARWASDSIVGGPGATFVFPKTLVHQYFGCADPSTGPLQGLIFARTVDAQNPGRATVTWEPAAPHQIFTDSKSVRDIASDMAANCAPRH